MKNLLYGWTLITLVLLGLVPDLGGISLLIEVAVIAAYEGLIWLGNQANDKHRKDGR